MLQAPDRHKAQLWLAAPTQVGEPVTDCWVTGCREDETALKRLLFCHFRSVAQMFGDKGYESLPFEERD